MIDEKLSDKLKRFNTKKSFRAFNSRTVDTIPIFGENIVWVCLIMCFIISIILSWNIFDGFIFFLMIFGSALISVTITRLIIKFYAKNFPIEEPLKDIIYKPEISIEEDVRTTAELLIKCDIAELLQLTHELSSSVYFLMPEIKIEKDKVIKNFDSYFKENNVSTTGWISYTCPATKMLVEEVKELIEVKTKEHIINNIDSKNKFNGFDEMVDYFNVNNFPTDNTEWNFDFLPIQQAFERYIDKIDLNENIIDRMKESIAKLDRNEIISVTILENNIVGIIRGHLNNIDTVNSDSFKSFLRMIKKNKRNLKSKLETLIDTILTKIKSEAIIKELQDIETIYKLSKEFEVEDIFTDAVIADIMLETIEDTVKSRDDLNTMFDMRIRWQKEGLNHFILCYNLSFIIKNEIIEFSEEDIGPWVLGTKDVEGIMTTDLFNAVFNSVKLDNFNRVGILNWMNNIPQENLILEGDLYPYWKKPFYQDTATPGAFYSYLKSDLCYSDGSFLLDTILGNKKLWEFDLRDLLNKLVNDNWDNLWVLRTLSNSANPVSQLVQKQLGNDVIRNMKTQISTLETQEEIRKKAEEQAEYARQQAMYQAQQTEYAKAAYKSAKNAESNSQDALKRARKAERKNRRSSFANDMDSLTSLR